MKLFLPLLALFILTIAACTEPITIGSDILDERGEVGQITDFPFEMRVVRDDSVLVYDASQFAPLGILSFGQSTDPVFGQWQHAFSITPALSTVMTQFNTNEVIIPEFARDDRPLIDSVVMILQIDTTDAFFGPERDEYDLPVQLLRLTAEEPESEDRYSTAPRPDRLGENLLEATSISATPLARPIYDSAYATTVPEMPHIRLKFTQAFVDEMNQLDSTNFATDTIFRETFAGAYLEPTGDSDALIKLRPRGGNNNFSGLYFFYEDPSENDTASFYRAPIRNWFVRYDHDYSGSVAEDLLAGSGNQDTLLVGGTGSVMTAITFPDRSALSDALINRAELRYYAASLEGYDAADFPTTNFLGLFYRNNAGNLVNIQDRLILGPNPTGDILNTFLGGFPEMDGDDVFYRNLLSRHLQGIIDNDFAEPTVYLRTVPSNSNPSRALLRGPGAAELPAEFTVTFSRSN